MRTSAIPAALAVLTAALAGCAGSDGKGTLNIHVTDAPGAIGQFESLEVEVSSIVLKHKGGDGAEKTDSYTPDDRTFDLTRLTDGNVTAIFGGSVANGTYTRIEFEVAKATGVLKDGGRTVPVDAPKGSIFVNTQFTVGDGSEVHFVFDIHVVEKGNGGYSLQPNAGGSKVIGEPKGGKIPA